MAKCKLCGKDFPTHNGAIYHEENYCKMNKNITFEYKCDFCDKEFTSDRGKLFHIEKYCKNCVRCSYCNKKFKTQNGAKYHEEKYCRKNTKKYSVFECDNCDKFYNDDVALMNHQLYSCGITKCNICKRPYHNETECYAKYDSFGERIY